MNSHPSTPTSPAEMTPEEQADKLSGVVSLAALFGTCVEAFGMIHPSKALDQQQKLALTRLGIQQARLLVFGNIVGISSPPALIATSMIPSQVDETNPDPTSPVYFDPRDARLDDAEWRSTLEATLREIVDRPAHMSREQMMDLYGLKPPRRAIHAIHPTLDSNRLEAFCEKYSLLDDLSESLACSQGLYRTHSITTQHWQVHDVERFSAFVTTVRDLVDKLIHLFGCKEQVDRAIKSDIRALGWHPEMPASLIRKDAEKLKLIVATCKEDYPEYVPMAEMALNYITQELLEDREPWPIDIFRSPIEAPEKQPSFPIPDHGKLLDSEKSPTPVIASSLPGSLVLEIPFASKTDGDAIKQDSAIGVPDETPLPSVSPDVVMQGIDPANILTQADTLNRVIEMFGQFKGIGALETKDIRLNTAVV